MKAPNLSLTASSPGDLLSQLATIDITVPLVTEGRRKEHREQYLMARLLATQAEDLVFPLELRHADGPDFVLSLGQHRVGVECVEAVPQELYDIEILKETQFPDSMSFGQHFKPGERNFTREEKQQVAKGELAGPPWMPATAKKNWIEAMKYVIRGKTVKLRNGNYSITDTVWLLVQDEWPNTIQYYPDQQVAATADLAKELMERDADPSFEAIFIASGLTLLRVSGLRVDNRPIRDLWR